MLARNKKDFTKWFKENELPLMKEQESKWQETGRPYIDYPNAPRMVE